MRLSIFSDYALRVLMHAALRSPALTTIDEVADAYQISRNHLSKVVHQLSQQQFLSTRRGVGGGFSLAQDPRKLIIGHVIRATEGDESVIDCMSRGNEPCIIFPACRLKGVLAEAAHAFYRVLDRYTLQDLVRKPGIKELLGI